VSVREGTELLFQQPRKRAVPQPEKPREPSTPEQVRRWIEQDLALTIRAKREQEENVAEAGRVKNSRSRFELTRDQIVFGIKLAVTLLCMVALIVFAFTGAEAVKLVLSGGGMVAGIISLLFGAQPRSSTPEEPVVKEDSRA
jgi:hypothetical protein